mmetsp:Transcript_18546/g.43711  ORF Transcript_18546/g.43711 Transcript_18546/m.43711 type:complete len:102 (+) Transcript_18546:60-365(+)
MFARSSRVFTRRFAPQQQSRGIFSAAGPVIDRLFSSNIVYVTSIVTAAVVAEQVFDKTALAIWEANNKGKLFDDVIGTFPESADDDEDEDEDDDDDDEDDE